MNIIVKDTHQLLEGEEPDIREMLHFPGIEDLEFDPPRLGVEIFRPADLG